MVLGGCFWANCSSHMSLLFSLHQGESTCDATSLCESLRRWVTQTSNCSQVTYLLQNPCQPISFLVNWKEVNLGQPWSAPLLPSTQIGANHEQGNQESTQVSFVALSCFQKPGAPFFEQVRPGCSRLSTWTPAGVIVQGQNLEHILHS